VLVLVLARSTASHGDSPAERKRRGDSFFLDGQFDGFARDSTPTPAAFEDLRQTYTPSIKINTSSPLRAGSFCETPDLGPHAPVHPYACGENGAWVEVSGQCATLSGVCWAGIFPASAPANMHTINPDELPGNNSKSPWTPPFMVPAPLKFSSVHCSSNLSKGDTNDPIWRRWWIPNTRQPVVLILFNGSESSAHETARSEPINFADSAAPMHLRLGRMHNVSQMRVSWTSSCSQDSRDLVVKWGTDPKQLGHTIAATSATCECKAHVSARAAYRYAFRAWAVSHQSHRSLASCCCGYMQTLRRTYVASRPRLWAGGSHTGSTQQSLTSCLHKQNRWRCITIR
jgi:hypothetical protein